MTESQDGKPQAEATTPVQQKSHMSIGRYLLTRIPTLKPPMRKAPNPLKSMLLLNTEQWLFFLVSFYHLLLR